MLSARYVPASILARMPGSIELICIWQGNSWSMASNRVNHA